MPAALVVLAAALLVLAVAVYVFSLAARTRRDAERSIRERETAFTVERGQHAEERSLLVQQLAELAGRPLFGGPSGNGARREQDEEKREWREAQVVPAGDQLID